MPATFSISESAAPHHRPLVEHAVDVLFAARDLITTDGGACLAIVSEISGGAVRAPGAMMAVGMDGSRIGYLSGGCIDADVASTALMAINSGEVSTQLYGQGSNRRDLTLPCGGAIDVAFWPMRDTTSIDFALAHLIGRRSAQLTLPSGKDFFIKPKLRLRLAGRGADLLAMGRQARRAGYELVVQTPDADLVADLRADGIEPIQLVTPTDLPDVQDDPYTAFVLLFHDPDWETPLLMQALNGPAFYIGAVGSARAQARRIEALVREGITDNARIKGPIGLAPSMRNASSLAFSTLAEIAALYEGIEQ